MLMCQKNRLVRKNDVFMRLLKSPENAKMSYLKTVLSSTQLQQRYPKTANPCYRENNPGTKWTMEKQMKASSYYTELM